MIKAIKILTLFLILFSISCSDDFLDHPLTGSVSDDNIEEILTRNPERITLFLGNAYRTLAGINLYGRKFYYCLPEMAHEVDMDWLVDLPWDEFSKNEITSSNDYVLVYYKYFYNIISTLNLTIELLDKISITDLKPSVVAKLPNYKGEALFLRAYCNFTLLSLFGEKGPHFGGGFPDNKDAQGIVLMLKTATAEDAFIGRSSVGECYNAIIADLKAAETLIGDDQIPVNRLVRTPGSLDKDYINNFGWAQKPAVKALLGKVYLYMNDYAEAKTEFESVINDSRFALDKPVNFTDYVQHSDNNPESIFSLQFYDYSGAADAYTDGPLQSVSRIMTNIPGGYKNTFIDKRTFKRFGTDPRLYEATLFDHSWSSWSTNTALPEWTILDTSLSNFRCYERKTIDFYDYSSPRDNTKNIDLIRLADIYLMYAEVVLNLGDADLAAEYVNRVRRRAWNEASYELPGTKGEDFITVDLPVIQEERYKELFFENIRWFDICRWGILQNELAKYQGTQAGTVIYDDQDYYLPIPESEINKNALLKQSLNY